MSDSGVLLVGGASLGLPAIHDACVDARIQRTRCFPKAGSHNGARGSDGGARGGVNGPRGGHKAPCGDGHSSRGGRQTGKRRDTQGNYGDRA